VFTTRLALGFAVVLAAATPVLPASASADYPSPATIARTAHGIDYAAYVVRRGAYGRTVVRRGPYRTVVRHRAPYYGRVVVRRPYYGYRAPYYGRTVVRRGPYRTVVRRRGW
jgi:hypothetical protein